MSTVSEFTARGAQHGDARAASHGQSTLRGPVVVLKGWREGMDKAAITLLLRECGIPLAQAYDVTNSILRDEPVSVQFPGEIDLAAVCYKLEELGAVL